MSHDPNDRMSAPVADCDKAYCTWDIGHKLAHNQRSIDSMVNPVPVVTTVAIPEKFSTAKTAFESFLSAFMSAIGPLKCPVVTSVACADAYKSNGQRV